MLGITHLTKPPILLKATDGLQGKQRLKDVVLYTKFRQTLP